MTPARRRLVACLSAAACSTAAVTIALLHPPTVSAAAADAAPEAAPATAPATAPASRPAVPGPTWPPRLADYTPGVSGRPGTHLDVSLRWEDGQRRVAIHVRGDQARSEGVRPPFNYQAYLKTCAFFARGEFVGIHQEFHGAGFSLGDEWTSPLPDPPAGADEVVVKVQTVLLDQNQTRVPTPEYSHWYTATYHHFTTYAPRPNGAPLGPDVRTTRRPVDQDLFGWMRDCEMVFDEGVVVTARLPLR